MGLQDILETIRSEAEETVSDLEARARAESDQILESAREKAEEEERRLSLSQDDRIRGERARALSGSHLEAARARRNAREEVFQKSIEAVRLRLGTVRESDRYESLMASLLDEAIAALPEATVLRVDPADVAVMRRVLGSRDLQIETEGTELGGLVVAAPGRTVDNRLATRLERAENHLRYLAGEIIPELRGE